MKDNRHLTPIRESISHRDFREMLKYAADAYRGDDAFIIKHKEQNDVSYEHIRYEDLFAHVNALGTAMLKRGYKGKRIALLGKNRYEWMLGYFASLCGIGYCVPLDKGLPYEEVESSLARSYSDILIFDKDHEDIVSELKTKNNTRVAEYICMDEFDGYTSIAQLISEGRRELEGGFDEYLTLPIDPDESTIILFTSGTTSMSKAVLLSQYNIMSNISSILSVEDIRRGDVNMAFLPYHHTFGSTGQLVMLSGGVTTAFCDGLKYLQKNIVEYKVSIFVCVPLLIESIYKKIMATVKKQGLEKKVNFGLKVSRSLLKVGIDVRRKLFKEILDQLGGNIRFVISGASAIDPEALRGFSDFGILAVQGYGMTESAPVISAENPENRRLGSIGKAIPGVDVEIFEPNDEGIGELIARGPNVMAGYYENPEATADVLKDGWLYTGDLASIDEDGFIFIRGRKKNVIVLKNGKNVYPEEIEVLISNLPYVEECMVFGQERHKDGDHKDLAICAKIVYNAEYMKESYGIDGSTADVERIIRKDIDAINDELPNYKHILRLIVTDEPMIKTTTGKVKRFEEAKNL